MILPKLKNFESQVVAGVLESHDGCDSETSVTETRKKLNLFIKSDKTVSNHHKTLSNETYGVLSEKAVCSLIVKSLKLFLEIVYLSTIVLI